MNYIIQFIPEHDLVIEHIQGEVTLEELEKKVHDLLIHPEFKKGLSGLIDMRKAFTNMSKTELQQFARFMGHSEEFKGSTWAVIGNDPMVIALSQVFQQVMSESLKIGVFGSVEPAAKFLGKPEVLDLLKV